MECGRNGKKRACHWCENSAHEIETCQEFVKKPINERTQFIIRKGLCLRCLTHGHMAKEKKCERVPSCAKCQQKHPTCLHDDSRTSTVTMLQMKQIKLRPKPRRTVLMLSVQRI